MTILSAQTLRKIKPLKPFVERGVIRGRSYGLSIAGYDITIDLENTKDRVWCMCPGDFGLFSCIEEFDMPKNLVGRVCDKSSWLRKGLRIGNTVIEPGWKGFLTIELFNCSTQDIILTHGDPISQILFETTDEETEGYSGKYQNQERGPVSARYEM